MAKQKLYIKNDKGRYEEYVEPVQEYDNKLYRKVGKKYEPCSMLMTNDLQEGVWVVVKDKYWRSMMNGKYLLEKYLCMKAGDLQEVSLAKLGGMERLAKHLSEHWHELPKNSSPYELCQAIVGILLKYETERGE